MQCSIMQHCVSYSELEVAKSFFLDVTNRNGFEDTINVGGQNQGLKKEKNPRLRTNFSRLDPFEIKDRNG